jgi:hypothetical protein
MQFLLAVRRHQSRISACDHTLKDATLCSADSVERHMERGTNISDNIEIQQVTRFSAALAERDSTFNRVPSVSLRCYLPVWVTIIY